MNQLVEAKIINMSGWTFGLYLNNNNLTRDPDGIIQFHSTGRVAYAKVKDYLIGGFTNKKMSFDLLVDFIEACNPNKHDFKVSFSHHAFASLVSIWPESEKYVDLIEGFECFVSEVKSVDDQIFEAFMERDKMKPPRFAAPEPY
ncbi:hypothetical protein KNT65_gp029 [Escherichia phage EcS1]|uniref:Uncharacterized protein n=1 Tax=Escherichia phage EcS1 TaxID=2083276 RepID=A0A2Z5ZC84_9CAUD|nr:hypothetical protein KNT65_gp029 [Escherichia phage EcS1]BBC78077.1 hypothetical protein [Escherichia phage EcS1]